MPLERIAITGSSGSYGRGVVRAVRRMYPRAVVLGLDVNEPAGDEPDLFARCDVTGADLIATLREFAPDTVIHLAFVVNPIHDDTRMRQVNIDGARNVLEAVRQCRPARVLFSSSATAYGAWPDNPVPMKEDWPLRAREDFRYAADKVAVERLLAAFRDQQPQIAVSWTRPSIIYGPGIRNYLTKFISSAFLIGLPDGNDNPIQFVHIDDLADATLMILDHDLRGSFNVSPPDWLTMRDVARLTGRVCMPVPLGVCRAMSHLWWNLRLPLFRFPPSMWSFMRYPWVVTPARLTTELGFRFRHSSLDTIKQMLDDRGYLRDDARNMSAAPHARAALFAETGRQAAAYEAAAYEAATYEADAVATPRAADGKS